MKQLGSVVVVAPDRQQSAVGHALSVEKPLRITKFKRDDEMFGFAVNGTPSDCVKIAVSNILDEKPDMIVSGINHGRNTAVNVLYSGTVSAATEGMLLGIPSIAVSVDSHSYKADVEPAAYFTRLIARQAFELIPPGTLLNINVPAAPAQEILGVRITRLSKNIWRDAYEERTDPFGRKYYWFAGEFEDKDKGEDTDEAAIRNNYVSVTPIRFAMTDFDSMKRFENIIISD
jgi:5'-nucleotidase